jgi:hypothetical protein
MKRASGWQLVYIYREIRRRHEWGYEFFNSPSAKLRAEDMDGCMRIKERSKEREAEQMIIMTVSNEQ